MTVKKIVIGVTGASGAPYARRLITVLGAERRCGFVATTRGAHATLDAVAHWSCRTFLGQAKVQSHYLSVGTC